jgi:multicomponent Na+:H+ antiporter subunit D
MLHSALPKKTGGADFVNLLILAVAGMNGVVIVGDLFSMYVFMEVVAVASFVLIASKQDKLGLEGSIKYLILSSLATVLMLASIAILILTTGGTSFAQVRIMLILGHSGSTVMLALALFIIGLFIKGGLVPFHAWLPDAYTSAPSEVSVLLAGIVTKTSGIYTLMRILTSVFVVTPPVSNIVLIAGIISVFAGALAALSQNDIKRMLSYSSISQVGYIVLGLGSGSALGFAGAAFHLFNHSIFKTQLFVNAAAIEEQTGTREIRKLGGLASKMPVTETTSLIAMLSTAGVPPLAGFWSKLLIIVALWMGGHHYLALLAVLASVITLAYFLSMNRKVFLGVLPDNLSKIKEASAGMLAPAVLLTCVTVLAGVFFPVVIKLLILPLMGMVR